jgi:hypothetical protein
MNWNLWLYLRVWWISSQLHARHSLPGVSVHVHHPLETLMLQALQSPIPKVWVHWGAFESGKTTAARNTASASNRTILHLYAYHVPWVMPLREWLVQHELGLRDTDTPSHFIKGVILDECDCLLYPNHVERTEDKLVAAARSLGVNILLIVSSWENAVALRQHGAELLGEPGCGRWTPEQLLRVASTATAFEEHEENDLAKRLCICELAQTPSGLLDKFKVHTWPFEEKRARLVAREWDNGIRALTTGDTSGAEGSFPDKRGTFHWDK